MNDLFYPSSDQLACIQPYFPKPHGVPRVDDLKVISGIIHVLKRGLQWRDAPKEYGPHKTLYTRFSAGARWGSLTGTALAWRRIMISPNSLQPA